MKTVLDVFTSRSRVGVLRTLCFQVEPIPLRHLACLSDLPIFSVQNTIESFVADAIVIRSKKDNNVLFELNRSHALYNLLREIFVLEMLYRVRAEAQAYSSKASRALKFANESGILFGRAKRRKP